MKKRREETAINGSGVHRDIEQLILYQERIPKVYVSKMGRGRLIQLLITLLGHPNSEMRMRTAEHLQYFRSQKVDKALIKTLQKDKNYLVKIQVAESLGNMRVHSACSALVNRLKDNNPLVRMYAASVLGQIGCISAMPAIQRALRTERFQHAKLGLYEAQYLLGKKSVLKNIISMLNSYNYRVRCAAANVLGDTVERNSASVILYALRKALEKEKTIAVKSSLKPSITKALRYLRGQGDVAVV